MNKRIFISFAMEDKHLKDFWVGQARNEKVPFEFVDMSVKQPWNSKWKTKCRTKIKGCDGVIAIVTKNTKKADGQLWEVKCSKEELIPIRGILGTKYDHLSSLQSEFGGVRVVNWAWINIANWIDTL